jgi:hypothetical protein
MKEGTTRTVLDITPSSAAQKLVEIYKKNPKEARIIYMNSGMKIIEKSLILWEDANGDWDISQTEKTFGISVTNKMYSRYAKTGSYMCKAGKFYIKFKTKHGYSFSQLTWTTFMTFIRGNDSPGMKDFLERLYKKTSWLRFVNENPIFHGVALNTFVKYKLYSRNKALKHFLKVPLPAALKLVEAVHQKEYLDRLFKEWKTISKMVTNVENLRPDILSNQYFVDTCRMAHVVGEKINLAWSDLRLKEEHDKYAELITHTILGTMEEKPLRIRKEYQDFCEKYGFHLFKTNKELYEEGRIQRHCVGTYEWEVNRGACAIFKHGGYTGELRYIEPSYERRLIKTLDGPPIEDLIPVRAASLRLNQFRGYLNRKAPDELSKEVYDKLDEFNEYLKTVAPATHDISGVTPSKGEWFMRADNRSHFNIFQKPYEHEPPVEMGAIVGRVEGNDIAWDDLVQGEPMELDGEEVMREQ